MIQITVTNEERERLLRILSRDLSELRMEIAGTDNMRFRQELKTEEEFLKKLIKVLEVEPESFPPGV